MMHSTDGRRHQVDYRCYRRGLLRCKAHLKPEFWRPVSFELRKTCGGSRHDIHVVSDLPSFPDVFVQGFASAAWSTVKPEVHLAAEETTANFLLNASSNLTLVNPIFNVSDTKTLIVELKNASVAGDRHSARG